MRRAFLWSLVGCLAAVGGLSVPRGAAAVPVVYTISSGGLDAGFICQATGACTSASDAFIYDPPPPNNYDPATGTITIDSAAGTVEIIALSVSSASFEDSAGAIAGVDEVVFTNLSYTATITGATFASVDQGTLITWVLESPLDFASISGDYEERLGGANVTGPTAFSLSTVRIAAGQCLLTLTDELVCGFTMGPGGTTPFQLPIAGANRRITHTLNVVAVPEPAVLGLLGLGALALALSRRRVA